MRNLAVIFITLAMCCSVGCARIPRPPLRSTESGSIDITPEQAIQRAKERFPLLRSDMDPKQVFATLGLRYDRILGYDQEGYGKNGYLGEFWIPGGSILSLEYDGTAKLIYARLKEAIWLAPEKVMH
jgi:hypothetical protein